MNELTWKQFKDLPHVQHLNENEQARQYGFYLEALENTIINWRRSRGGGRQTGPPVDPQFEYLTTESGIYIITEDGEYIRVS